MNFRVEENDSTLSTVLLFLAPQDLLKAGLVSRQWLKVASSDYIWSNFLLTPSALYGLSSLSRKANSKKVAFYVEVNELNRPFVLREEICGYDDSSECSEWNFRFKEAAGEEWTAICPWHKEGSPGAATLKFLPNGKIVRPNTLHLSQVNLMWVDTSKSLILRIY